MFGSLFQITSNRDEIFINSATVNDIEIIDSITAGQLAASGSVVNNAISTIATETIITSNNTSSTSSVTSPTNNTSGGSTTTSSSNSGGGYSY